MFVGGMLLLIATTSSDQAAQSFFNQNSDFITQANLSKISDIIGYDLKKMGYGVEEADTVVFVAQANQLKYITHLNSHPVYRMNLDGVNHTDTIADTIEYTVSATDTIEYGLTSIVIYNIQRRLRIPPSVDIDYSIGTVANEDIFTYLDQAGNPTLNLMAVSSVELQLVAYNAEVVLSPELVMQNVNPSDSTLRDFQEKELLRILRPSYWKESRFTSRNLNR
jgi:hypothetical protein